MALPPYVVTRTWYETSGRDKVKVTEVDEGPTADWAEREAELWAEIWRTPQACAWSLRPRRGGSSRLLAGSAKRCCVSRRLHLRQTMGSSIGMPIR